MTPQSKAKKASLNDKEKTAPQLYDVAEEFIVHHIPDELVSVLQTAVLLQVELGIECEAIYDLYPKLLTLE